MNAEILTIDPAIVPDLNNRLLLPNGRIRLLPSAEYLSIPRDHLRAWCHATARYLIPTIELVDWLKEVIGDRKAIEIGSGNGDLGHYLGIPETDSYCQTLPGVKSFFAAMGQIPTSPPQGVIKIDALDAIKKYKPDVVIGAWLTRKFIQGKDIEGVSQASAFGPKEENILKKCDYIHIGNWGVHGEKTILSQPYREYRFPWLVSRANNPERDMILIWERGGS